MGPFHAPPINTTSRYETRAQVEIRASKISQTRKPAQSAVVTSTPRVQPKVNDVGEKEWGELTDVCVYVCGWWLLMPTFFFDVDVNGYPDDGLDDS